MNSLPKFLFLYCFSFYAVHASIEHYFIQVYTSSNSEDVKKCFDMCCDSNDQMLNLTKHLISHKHVKDVTEVAGQIPAIWILDNTPKDFNLFCFVRELYTVNDIYISLEECKLEKKFDKLTQLQRTFQYASQCEELAATSLSVLEVIGGVLAVVEKRINLLQTKNFVDIFLKQYQRLHANVINQRMIAVIDLLLKKSNEDLLSLNPSLDNFRKNLDNFRKNPSLNLDKFVKWLNNIKIKDNSCDCDFKWTETVTSIKEKINPFFVGPLSHTISGLIKDAFLPTIKKYAKEFSKHIDMLCDFNKNMNAEIVSITLMKQFSKAAFMELVNTVIGSSFTSAAADIKVIAPICATTEQSTTTNLIVDDKRYSILNVYLASFYPSKSKN